MVAVEFTWQVEKAETRLSYAGLADVVDKVHWRLVGTDSATGEAASEYGEIPLDLDAIDPATFMTKAQLEADPSILIGWATALISATAPDAIPAMKARITDRINEKIAPTAGSFGAGLSVDDSLIGA